MSFGQIGCKGPPPLRLPMQTMKRAHLLAIEYSVPVAKAIGAHAAILGLRLQEVAARGEVWLRPLPEAHVRLQKGVQEASLQQ